MSKATRWQIIKTATGQVGYTEGGGRDGRSGNITKYWAKHYPQWQGSPWCGAFVYWVLQSVGVIDEPVGKTGIFYTPSIVNAAKSKGVWHDDSQLSKAKPGDLVLFDFNGSNYAKHVGFVEKYLGNGVVQTIEGNTSPTNRGSQNNGGGVYRRVRDSSSVMGFVDMSKWVSDSAPSKYTPPPKKNAPSAESTWRNRAIMVDGDLGPNTVRRLQAEVGVTVDGALGPNTKKAVQRWVGVSADGVWGPATIKAIQRKVGSRQDGDIGPNTIKALQNWLNNHRR